MTLLHNGSPTRRGATRSPRRHFAWFAVAAGLLIATMTPALGQTAQLRRLLQLDAAYSQHKAANRWDLAAQDGEEMVAIARQYQLSWTIELAAMDQLALARLNLADYREASRLYQKVVEATGAIRATDAGELASLRRIRFNSLTGLGRVHRELDDQVLATDYFQHAIQFAEKNGMSLEAAQGTTDLAFSLAELRREDEAIALLLKQLPVLKRASDPRKKNDPGNSAYANALHCLGFIYNQLGRYDLGEPYHHASLDVILANVGPKHAFTATVIDAMAAAYTLQGRVSEAEELYRIEIGIFEKTIGLDHPRCAVALNNLARLLEIERGKHAEAETMARQALAIKREFYEADSAEIAVSLVNLSNILTFQDRWAAAEPIAEEALEIYRKTYGMDHPETAQCLQLLASCYGMGGDWKKSLETVDLALEGNQKRPYAMSIAAMLYASKATILQQLDRPREAAEAMDEALRFLEIQRTYSAGAERERAVFLEKYAAFYDRAIAQQAELHDTAAMFALTEQVKARSFLDELQVQRADFLADVPEAERRQLLAEESRLRQALSAANAKLDAAPRLGDQATEEQRKQHDALVQAIHAARDALYDHAMRVRAASPQYRELIASPAEMATLEQLQKTLGADELVLSYTVGEFNSYVFAIRSDRVAVTELVLDEPVADLFAVEPGPLTRDKLGAMLLPDDGVMSALSNPNADSDDFLDKLAALWLLLVPEPQRAALTGEELQRLTILPAGSLSLLPFEALVIDPRQKPAFLLDVGPPIAYAPSASVLLNLAERNEAHETADAPIFTLGDPAYPQTEDQAVGKRASSDSVRAHLSRLKYSNWEAHWVQEHFNKAGIQATLVTGAAATEQAVRTQIGGRRIVHLACHGGAEQSYSNFFGALYVMPGKGVNPANDGVLLMSEIYGLDLAGCELAVLSACQTNYGPEQRGEGVWALSRGFLVAGARRVLASNWVINDEAGATLVGHFASYLCTSSEDPAGYDYAQSLQQAKRAVRNDERWTHPFFWSSLVLIGPK